MPLHIDERPKEFKDFIGNPGLISSLESLLQNSSHPHSYLFTGPAGCGKTTLARIIASYLKCNEYDITEINMSNNRGIDTARDIIDQSIYKPLKSPVKVYILDEIHKSTKDFQNALLKILEEPPSHVYFILCTTEPDQLLKTIKSRCALFTVNPFSKNRMKQFLELKVKKLKLEFDESVYIKIAEESLGSPRQALIMLDQIKGMKDTDKILKTISSIKTEEAAVIDLCRALLNKESWNTITKILRGLQDEEPEKIRRAVLGYASAVLLSKENKQAALMIECFKDNYYDSGKAGLLLSCYEIIL